MLTPSLLISTLALVTVGPAFLSSGWLTERETESPKEGLRRLLLELEALRLRLVFRLTVPPVCGSLSLTPRRAVVPSLLGPTEVVPSSLLVAEAACEKLRLTDAVRLGSKSA